MYEFVLSHLEPIWCAQRFLIDSYSLTKGCQMKISIKS